MEWESRSCRSKQRPILQCHALVWCNSYWLRTMMCTETERTMRNSLCSIKHSVCILSTLFFWDCTMAHCTHALFFKIILLFPQFLSFLIQFMLCAFLVSNIVLSTALHQLATFVYHSQWYFNFHNISLHKACWVNLGSIWLSYTGEYTWGCWFIAHQTKSNTDVCVLNFQSGIKKKKSKNKIP